MMREALLCSEVLLSHPGFPELLADYIQRFGVLLPPARLGAISERLKEVDWDSGEPMTVAHEALGVLISSVLSRSEGCDQEVLRYFECLTDLEALWLAGALLGLYGVCGACRLCWRKVLGGEEWSSPFGSSS